MRTHHLHLVAKADPQGNDSLRLWDVLSADKVLRGEYAELKWALPQEFAQDRKSYVRAKYDFIQAFLQQAFKV